MVQVDKPKSFIAMMFDRLNLYQFITSCQNKPGACFFFGTIFFLMISSYTSNFNGATCGYVKNDKGTVGLAEVAVRLNVLKVNEQYDAATLKFPVLVFKYTDRENFTNIPTLDVFRKYYESDDIEFGDYLINSDHKFRLDVAEGKTLNEDELYNDYLMLYNSTLKGKPHMRASFNVTRSGLYCAYVATPPLHGAKKTIKLGIGFKNSFGKFSYYAQLLSSQLKYFFITTSLILTCICYDHHRFTKQGVSVNFDSISRIFGMVMSYFAAKIIFNIISVICLYSSNEFSDFSLKMNYISNVSLLFITYDSILRAALGYGTISAINFETFVPVNLSASVLLSFFLSFIEMVLVDPFDNSSSSILYSSWFKDILFISAQLLPTVWKVVIVACFNRTKKIMILKGQTRYLNPLQQSILFVIVSPIICAGITSKMFNTNFKKVLLFHPLYDIPATIMKLRVVYFDVLNTSVSEVGKLDPNLNLASIWSEALNIYANVIFIYFTWFKDNKGSLFVIEDVEAKYEPLDVKEKEKEENE
ncbi:hypothetical protein DFJ63DRAFT_170417 [Scheffersomyces coipomensis]|uniref:uncharacterized protein n=1 Tax=Scheffersomyces coipomensis TaxID=1788519 RepID=UPI00315CAC32